MQIKFSKADLVRRARARLSAATAHFGPTGGEVDAFLKLCGGKGGDITFQLDGTKAQALPAELRMDGVLDVIAGRVRPYTGMGAFVANMLHEELEGHASERGHREFEVKGVKCFDNNGVLHLTTSVRDCRRGTLLESRAVWNVTRRGFAVNVGDPFVADCISCGGLDLPLTRWFAGAYPKGDYCTISNLAAYGTDEKE